MSDSLTNGIQRFTEAHPEISDHLEKRGVLGVLLVDMTPLRQIERYYGVETYETIRGRLGTLVRDISKNFLDKDEMIITDGAAGDELTIFIFRERTDHRFFQEELPSLVEAFHLHFARQGNRIVYPYLRGTPRLPVGYSIAIHNPAMGMAGQVNQSILLAREDAALNAKVEHRRRRQRIVQMILTEDVTAVYQPILDLHSDELLGFEALIRGPEKSPLFNPSEIFKNASDFDLTFELDCLCRRTALRDLNGRELGVKLFLNCLPTAIKDPAFQGDTLQRRLDELHLHPKDVVLEISEKETISNFSLFREIRDHYSGVGFQIAVDDVGVGYSSLESVVELAPNYIKVDIALIRGLDSDRPRQEMLRTLNDLAHKLGAEIIAEGIERQEELDALRKIGIRFGQGFLLGRPGPLEP